MRAEHRLSLLRVATMLLAAAALVAATSCGGGSSSNNNRNRGGGEKAPEPAPQAAAEEKVEEDDWSLLEPYFKRFTDQAATGFKDPLQPQLVHFSGKDEVVAQILAAAGSRERELQSAVATLDLPKGPLQRFPLSAYDVVIIQTGTADPRAVLVSPAGNAFPVGKDTYVGQEGGFIEDITQYYVVFRLPGYDEPVIKSLKPQLLDTVTQGGDEDFLMRQGTGN